MAMLPRIYCDMDGVLADFKTAAVKTTGMSINKWMNIPSSKKKWEAIRNESSFWYTLPWMPGGKQLWRFIEKYKPHILSAYVEESTDPNCVPGKTKWLQTYAGISNKRRINLVRRSEKGLYAKMHARNGDKVILIDDYPKNVEDFTRYGGIGIYHTNSSSTISKLKKLGF